jgi:hypothetical protein
VHAVLKRFLHHFCMRAAAARLSEPPTRRAAPCAYLGFHRPADLVYAYVRAREAVR